MPRYVKPQHQTLSGKRFPAAGQPASPVTCSCIISHHLRKGSRTPSTCPVACLASAPSDQASHLLHVGNHVRPSRRVRKYSPSRLHGRNSVHGRHGEHGSGCLAGSGHSAGAGGQGPSRCLHKLHLLHHGLAALQGTQHSQHSRGTGDSGKELTAVFLLQVRLAQLHSYGSNASTASLGASTLPPSSC